MTIRRFSTIIRDHYRRHGRHDMPWRRTKDPYRILVSEIMLQQTQVGRVTPFYKNFIKKFPGFRRLAGAKPAAVLRAWQGLGYNRRALALQKLSTIVLEKFNGRLPRGREDLESLPGIGKATAGALRAFAFNEREVFIETNIRRVFIHFFFPSRARVTDAELERYIKRALPRKDPREWYWALMDYGAMLGTQKPVQGGMRRHGGGAFFMNPNRRSAAYKRQSRFAGSDRELRGKILRLALAGGTLSTGALAKKTGEPMGRVKRIAAALKKEGFFAGERQNAPKRHSLNNRE